MRARNQIIPLGCAAILGTIAVAVLGQVVNTPTGPMQDPIQALQVYEQQIHQLKLDHIKSDLAMNDAEFAIIKPKIERLMETEATLTLVVGKRHSKGDFAAEQAMHPSAVVIPGPSSPLLTASMDLSDTLSDPNSTAELIASRLQTYKMEKAKLDQELGATEAEMVRLLTTRQEAVLVLRGLLD